MKLLSYLAVIVLHTASVKALGCDNLSLTLSIPLPAAFIMKTMAICAKQVTKEMLLGLALKMQNHEGSGSNWFHILSGPLACSQIDFGTFVELDRLQSDSFFVAWLHHCYHPRLSAWIPKKIEQDEQKVKAVIKEGELGMEQGQETTDNKRAATEGSNGSPISSSQLLAFNQLMVFANNEGELRCDPKAHSHLIPLLPALLAHQLQHQKLDMHWTSPCLQMIRENAAVWAKMELQLHQAGQGSPDTVNAVLQILPTLSNDPLIEPLVLGIAEVPSTKPLVTRSKFAMIGIPTLQKINATLDEETQGTAIVEISDYLESNHAVRKIPLPILHATANVEPTVGSANLI